MRISFSGGTKIEYTKKRKDKKEGLIGNIIDYFASKIQFCDFYQYDAHHIPPILNQINFNVD